MQYAYFNDTAYLIACTETLEFLLMTNDRCVFANEITSSEYAGSKGQQPVKWH